MRLKSRGDTIVEVMIALAVISLTVALSYATAQRSLRIGQRAQERTEALKVAESQLEALRIEPGLPGNDSGDNDAYLADYTSSHTFCVAASGTNLFKQGSVTDDSRTAGLVLSATAVPVGPNVYHSSCQFGSDARYHVSISREDQGGGASRVESTFTVRVRWYQLGGNSGNGIEELVLFYKLHKGMFGR